MKRNRPATPAPPPRPPTETPLAWLAVSIVLTGLALSALLLLAPLLVSVDSPLAQVAATQTPKHHISREP
ncbi:MAG: hypothetical protein ACFCUJ_13440 [Thiotrichales bacterium]